MILEAALLVSAVVLVIVAILGWAVYKLAEIRRDKASIDDLNRVIDHLNSLSHGVHSSQRRAERRLDDAEGDVRSANQDNVALRASLDAMSLRLDRVGEVSDGAMSEVHGLSNAVSNLDWSNTSLLENVRELQDASETYATWSNINEGDLNSRSMNVQGHVSAEEYRFGVDKIKIKGDESGLTLIGPDEEDSDVKITTSGISWGSRGLGIMENGSLEYCDYDGCTKILTSRDLQEDTIPTLGKFTEAADPMTDD